MSFWRSTGALILLAVAALPVWSAPAPAQSGDAKTGKQQSRQAPPPPDPAKERERRQAEYTEAAKALSGPAGHPECVWTGRRAVSLIWRDDLDTAFRHLELYDRFGCPRSHIKTTFRCLVQLGDIDPKVPESLQRRVHSCWVDPSPPRLPSAEQAAPPKK